MITPSVDQKARPLVVDLDGTLIQTDLLLEAANRLMTTQPARVLEMLSWLSKGRANVKAQLADAVSVDIDSLPLNRVLIQWLEQQKALGRMLVLATASHVSLAEKVATRVGLFDLVIGSNGVVNLKSRAKREELVRRFGERGFDYVGNEAADLPVWASCSSAIVVGGSPRLHARVRAVSPDVQVIESDSGSRLNALVRAMRPYQWVKNVLLFVPAMAAHLSASFELAAQLLIAFLVFGLTASSVYLLNDLVDVESDRRHARKRSRPFASGALGLLLGWATWPLLLSVAFVCSALFLPQAFTLVLVLYFCLTVAYSLRLKQGAMVDVLSLAALYTLRIVAGAAAASVPLSFWLLAFSMFMFLSLACIKRYSELKWAHIEGRAEKIPGRGYFPADFEIVAILGAASGYNAVLVLALYIQDDRTAELYMRPEFIWLVCPLLLYWISRAWLFAHRGWMTDDPIVFALKDRMSWIVGALIGAAFVIAGVGV